MRQIEYKVEPAVSDEELNGLFESAWEKHRSCPFGPILTQSLTYVCAFDGDRLVGFVNVARDGGIHGFILDTTVHRDYQRQGIGAELMKRTAEVAKERGIEWLHVDYEPHLDSFYRGCGYRKTDAGLLNLREGNSR
jgi:GNAT superfamily N-acetyltransferase